MAKRQLAFEEPLSEIVRDEAIAIPAGDTTFTVDLDVDTVEQLERGICPETLSNRMHSLLKWRRDAIRQDARRGVGYGQVSQVKDR